MGEEDNRKPPLPQGGPRNTRIEGPDRGGDVIPFGETWRDYHKSIDVPVRRPDPTPQSPPKKRDDG